jgi:spore germination protein PA
MPAVVGAVQVISIGTGGVFHIGDVYRISPYAATKTFAGAGSFNTGDGLFVYNQLSNTNTYDADVMDENILLNN